MVDMRREICENEVTKKKSQTDTLAKEDNDA